MAVTLWHGDALAGEGVTNADGRIADLLATQGERALVPGAYRLSFAVGAYRRAQGAAEAFFERVTLDLTITDTGRAYHVPLLLSPFGCTTYRGS